MSEEVFMLLTLVVKAFNLTLSITDFVIFIKMHVKESSNRFPLECVYKEILSYFLTLRMFAGFN